VTRVLLLALALAACGRSEEKKEGQRILALVDRMRDSDLAARGPLLDALDRERPATALAERVRGSCLAAYRALEDANLQIDAAGKEMDAIKLKLGEKLLDEAQAKLPACNEAVADLYQAIR
jgi:hypothetical protein